VAAAGIDDFARFADCTKGAFGFDELADDLHDAATPAQTG
jgi:hypothetical protein